jgi:hypothetical protein
MELLGRLSLRREEGVRAKAGEYGIEVEWVALGSARP